MQKHRQFRILYAESDEDSSLLMKTLLGFSNIAVKTAGTVTGALQSAGNERFDLFLITTRFPDGDGFELCRRLREIAPSAPVIFYSGDARPVDRQRGIAAGAEVYLVKPYSEQVVSNLLQFTLPSQKVAVRRGAEIYELC